MLCSMLHYWGDGMRVPYVEHRNHEAAWIGYGVAVKTSEDNFKLDRWSNFGREQLPKPYTIAYKHMTRQQSCFRDLTVVTAMRWKYEKISTEIS